MTLPTSGPLTLGDIQTEFGGSNPIAMNEYYAGGTYVASGTSGTYGAVPSSGALSVQNFYGTSAVIPAYIEEVFSTYLYTGNGSTQTITNGIDLSGQGGMVWVKARNIAYDPNIQDTVRGAGNRLLTDDTGASVFVSNSITSFNSNGFSLGSQAQYNSSSNTFVSWTFREQPKFFDIVTWTGTGANPQVIPHNLGSVPGCIIVKVTNDIDGWGVYHRSLSNTQWLGLNTTAAVANGSTGPWGATTPTSTQFTVGSYFNSVGLTFVAYLFAHDAGGFGAAGTDNVISCGSFTTDGSGNATVTLNYEPQWVMYKRSSGTGNWKMVDVMRGYTTQYGPSGSNGLSNVLYPNLANAELVGSGDTGWPTATGFGIGQESTSSTFIYVAIRRGPMKTPTVGTNVFAIASAVSTAPAFVSNAVVDTGFNTAINAGSLFFNQARLTGQDYLDTRSTAAAGSDSSRSWDYMKGMLNNQSTNPNNVGWMFGRAPSFMDVVCYRGTGNNPTNFSHNLAAVPELMILKKRSDTDRWEVYSAALGSTMRIDLNTDGAATTVSIWGGTPTTTQFSLTSNPNVNQNGQTYVAYLFATCAGVSKVGSYTGNGATQTINCGFTGGARFVLIKRTDSTGGWYVYDTLRGMTALTDPYVLMNAPAAAQTDTLGSVTTVSTGFALNAAILAATNTNGASYIFLAIA